MVLYSPPINIIRYANGTLIKLTASRHEFVSYDYNPETGTGTFQPEAIAITASLSGNISLKEWQYSTSGSYQALNGVTGVTISGNIVTIAYDSALFNQTDTVTIRAIADDGIHDDTVTISRIVDPKIVYNKTYTSIEQTNDKIALIASQEQLAQLTTEETFITRYSEYVQEAGQFRQTVESSYATKVYADGSASSAASTAAAGAVTTANAYTDGKLSDYSTTTQMRTEISQSERDIMLSVSQTYASKTYADNAAGSAETAAITAANGYTDTATAGLATEGYADTAAGNAERTAKGYADTKLQSYSTTNEMNSAIQAKADEIGLSVQQTYATKQEMESATEGMYTLETPYDFDDGTYTFSARIFKNSEEFTVDDGQIEWFKRSEDYTDMEYIANGKNMTIADTAIGYGGTIVCRLSVLSDEFNLTTETDAAITEEHGETLGGVTEVALLTTETTLYKKDYLKNKFAAITVTQDRITSEVSRVETKFDNELQMYVTTTQWSTMTETVEGIQTEVGRKVGTDEIISRINQSPESVTIQARKINLQGAVTADCIATGAVTADKIDSGAITTDKLDAEAVTADKIDVTDLFAQDIEATGTISGATLVGADAEILRGQIGDWIIDENGFLRNSDGSVILSPDSSGAPYISVDGFEVYPNGVTHAYRIEAYDGFYLPSGSLPGPGVDAYENVLWSSRGSVCVGSGNTYMEMYDGDGAGIQAVINGEPIDLEQIVTNMNDIEDHEDRIKALEDEEPTYPKDIKCDTIEADDAVSVYSLTVLHDIDCTEIDATGHINGGNITGSDLYTKTGSTAGGSTAVISSSGRVAPSSSSSKRYKIEKGYVDADKAKKLLDLPVIQFQYKDGYIEKGDELEHRIIPGFYAEDVENLIPEAVFHKDGKVENWMERIILPLLLKLVQEQQKEINELKELIKGAN